MATATTYPTVFAFDTHAVRSFLLEDEPWFVAGDVAEILGYTHVPHMTRLLDDDERGTHIVDTPGGPQEMTVISESGLYAAILKSRKPEAKRFRKWVTSEVLPAIRRNGAYGTGDNSQIVGMLATLVERMDRRDMQLMAFVATQSPGRRSASTKTPITREHETRAKALQAEGLTVTEIAEALGISRPSASLLVHDKYPFSVAQQFNS